MAATAQALLFNMSAGGQDLLQKLGMNVDFQVMDWGTLLQRRASEEPPAKGGWHIFITSRAGQDKATPVTSQPLRANGAKARFGWPDLPPLQQSLDAWLDQADLAGQKKVAGDVQENALDLAPYLPLGLYRYDTACRADIIGIIPGQFVFRNVRRTV